MKRVLTVLLACLLLLGAVACADGGAYSMPELTFTQRPFYGGQKLNVYSGPGREFYRGANGYAKADTDGEVMAAGKENDWVLVMYETKGGSVRVGYVDMDEFKYDTKILKLKELPFAYARAAITGDCVLTDDPALAARDLGALRTGDEVTLLATYYKHRSWAYIETWMDGRPIRGFVPAACVSAK